MSVAQANTQGRIRPVRAFQAGDILVSELPHLMEPTRYFKCLRVESDFGVVHYRSRKRHDTLGMAYVHKANALQKLLYHLYYRHLGPEYPVMRYVRWRARLTKDRIRSKRFVLKWAWRRLVSPESLKPSKTLSDLLHGGNNGQR